MTDWAAIIVFTFIGILTMVCVALLLDIREQNYATTTKRKGRLNSLDVFQRFVKLSEGQEAKLSQDLRQANMNVRPIEFMGRKLSQGLLIGGGIAVVGYIMGGDILIYVLAAIAGWYGYQQPTRSLKARIARDQVQIKLELPKYLKSLTTLLRTQTAFDAVRESVNYARPVIRPHVEKLVVDITQSPGSQVPYMEFAKRMNIDEAKQYMIILYQSIEVSQKNTLDFLEKLNRMNAQLEKEAVNILVETEPQRMTKYVFGIFACMIILPLAMAGVTMYNIFTGF